MTYLHKEIRPQRAAEGGSKSFGGDIPMVPGTDTLDLVRLSARDRFLFDQGHLTGYIQGHMAGARWADDRASAMFREAVQVVRHLAGFPVADPEAAKHRADERARRWSA